MLLIQERLLYSCPPKPWARGQNEARAARGRKRTKNKNSNDKSFQIRPQAKFLA